MAWEGLGSWWSILAGKELDARELRSLSGLSDARSFRQLYPCRDIDAGLVGTTIPDKPIAGTRGSGLPGWDEGQRDAGMRTLPHALAKT